MINIKEIDVINTMIFFFSAVVGNVKQKDVVFKARLQLQADISVQKRIKSYIVLIPVA